jgi:anaerobic ribonucleoside-triphosphate reductase activating protein
LTNKLKENDINIWCYTGFVFENLVKDELYKKILNNIDVLVDGPFILSQKSLALLFRGSKNQRLIDVKETMKRNKIVLYKE